MTSSGDAGPRVNQAHFTVSQKNKVLAIVAGGRLAEAMAALAGAGFDLAEVDVLEGEAGAGILDFDGTGHGRWAHVVRVTQKLGTASNERENYAAALRDGDAVVLVPVHDGAGADACGRVLVEHGGRRVLHVSRYTAELISY
jgi:hypothetical protein